MWRAVAVLALVSAVTRSASLADDDALDDESRKEIAKIENELAVAATELSEVIGVPVKSAHAGTLLRAYVENEVAADKKFKGSLVMVIGIVSRVKRDDDGDPYVILTAPEIEERNLFGDYLVICRFKKADEEMLVRAKGGKPAMLTGKCMGLKEIFDDTYILLDDCGATKHEYDRKLPEFEKQHAALEAKMRTDAENEEKERVAKKAVEDAKKRMRAAAGSLRLGKKMLADGDEKHGREWLRRVVKNYPGTEAAEEAKKLLEAREK